MNLKRRNSRKTLGTLASLALAGLVAGLASCDSSSPVDVSTPEQKAQFREMCVAKGGTVNETSCKGTSSCKGLYLNGETGKTQTNTCAGTNSCAGIQCLDTVVVAPSDSTAKLTALKAARTAAAFTATCTGFGIMSRAEAECAGHNTCAGVRFLTESSTVEKTSCAGTGSCKGISCPDAT